MEFEDAEDNVSSIVNNARLEHMHLTEDEIERVRAVALGEKTSKYKPYHVVEDEGQFIQKVLSM